VDRRDRAGAHRWLAAIHRHCARIANTTITHAIGPIESTIDISLANGSHVASRGGPSDGGKLIVNGGLNVPGESL
jgi:hypothetical protein